MIRFPKGYFFLFNYIYLNSNKCIRLIILRHGNGDQMHVPKVARPRATKGGKNRNQYIKGNFQNLYLYI